MKSVSKNTRITETINYGGRFRNNPRDQAELFNEYFFNQFSEPSNYNIPIDYRNNRDVSSVISKAKIHSLLRNIDINKAPGMDNIHGKFLKMCATSLAYPLYLLFKTSLVTGDIPGDWKNCNIVPIYNKGYKCSVENYRPISLTSLVMKVLEKCIRDEIMSIYHSKIDSKQHGCTVGKSCTTQMISFTDSLSISLNMSSQTDVIYFDFAKAFDSVSHDIILHKLKYQFNIDGSLLKFLKSYLSDRKQCVSVGAVGLDLKM